jgi:hypothetical protein
MSQPEVVLGYRERDTIIAALRLWQEHLDTPLIDAERASALDDVATNERVGPEAKLSSEEIDALIDLTIEYQT